MAKIEDDQINVNIDQETPELLESSTPEIRSAWIKQIVRDFLIFVIGTLILVIVLIATRNDWHESWKEVQENGFSGIKAALTLLPDSFLLYCGFLDFLLMIIIFIKTMVELIRGPVKAGLTPEKTLIKYFTPLFFPAAPSNWVDAYVCLLNKSKNDYNGYQGFVRYWRTQREELFKQIDIAFEENPALIPDSTPLNLTMLEDNRQIRKYLVLKLIKIKQGDIIFNWSIGSVVISEEVYVYKIGNRWYLSLHNWNPKIDITKKEGRK